MTNRSKDEASRYVGRDHGADYHSSARKEWRSKSIQRQTLKIVASSQSSNVKKHQPNFQNEPQFPSVKSTPEQAAMRRELKTLVEDLGLLAWERNPNVAPCAIIDRHDSPVVDETEIDYDEFFVVEKHTTAIPAKQTRGMIILRFRRRVTKDRKHEALWHVWEPGYAATKPETVEELLPLLKQLVTSFALKNNDSSNKRADP